MKDKFVVIDGSKKSREKLPELLTCSECNGATFLPARSHVIETDHGRGGGVDELVCVHCLANGKITTV